MSNTINVSAINNGFRLPLRGGSMQAVLDFSPDSHFEVGFQTEDTKNYTISSSLHQIQQLDGTYANTLNIGGMILLFVDFMFDTNLQVWKIVRTNMVSQKAQNASSSGSTTGGTGGTTTVVGSTIPTPTQVGYILTATGSADGDYAWAPAPTSGGTGGTTSSGEVTLAPDSNGQITPNAALGNAFRIVIDGPFKMMNPVGYNPGDKITVHFVRGATAIDNPTWDINYGLVNRQPPILAPTPGAINRMDMALTAGPTWTCLVTPDSTYTLGYAPASFIARNVQRQTQYYVLRSGSVPATSCGVTDMRPGETLKILRSGLGIEAYGGIDDNNGSGTYLISGALPNGNRAELRTGPGVRSAYDNGVLACYGSNTKTITYQDLIVSGAREQSGNSHTAKGFSVGSGNYDVNIINCKSYDNEDGCLTANDYSGKLSIVDSVFDSNGFGSSSSSTTPDGSTHNIYYGHTNQEWTALRSTFSNAGRQSDSDGGHNIKSRAGITTLNQVRTYNSWHGREMDIPNGGVVHATNCIFEHTSAASQNDCIRIAGEGVDTSRPREYIFRNCRFINMISLDRQASFIWTEDTGVPVQLIDCEFVGPSGTNYQWAGSTSTGMQGAAGSMVQITFTGGPTGPQLPVGYNPTPVTQING